MDSSQDNETLATDGNAKRKTMQSSTDDEADNTIRMGIGSVVNSLYSNNKDKKQAQADPKRVKAD